MAKQFFILVSYFFLTVIVGTLSHELGHYVVGRWQGYEVKLCYNKTLIRDKQYGVLVDSTISAHLFEIQEGSDYAGKQIVDSVRQRYAEDSLASTVGGPLQTMLTGSIALLLLFRLGKNSRYSTDKVSVSHWLLICLALFWLRQPVNLVRNLVDILMSKHHWLISDEVKLSYYFGLPLLSMNILTALLGIAVFFIILRYFIPTNERKLFLFSLTVGGVLGVIMWMGLLGPAILPAHW